jgi:hypothetical protein
VATAAGCEVCNHDGTLQSTSGEADHCPTGRVQPLHVVDGEQHRTVDGHGLHDPGERRGHHPLVRHRSITHTAEQHALDGDSLYRGQLVEDGRGRVVQEVVEEVGYDGVGEHRLRLGRAGRRHPKTFVTRTVYGS